MKRRNLPALLKGLSISLVLALGLCLPGPALAAETTTVSVSAPGQPVGSGEEFTVSIVVEPGAAIAGVQFDLAFDASLVSASSVEEGNLLTQDGANTYFNSGVIDNEAGTIDGVAGAVISPGQTVSTAGTFATITLTSGTEGGTCPFTLSNVIVGDIVGQSVPVSLVNGDVTVSGNRPPVLNPIGDKVAVEEEPLEFIVSASDPDGDALTYSASNLPEGASFDTETQTFYWMPSVEQAGVYLNVHFEVSDGSLTDSEDITIFWLFDEVYLHPIGDKSVNVNELLEFTVLASDPDGDPLTYSASNLPEGASFDAGAQTFSWTPSSEQVGIHPNIHFEVSDGSFIASEDIAITVVSPAAAGGGGGGGGGGSIEKSTLGVDFQGSSFEAEIQAPQGILLEPLSVSSPDALITFDIARYAYVLMSDGSVIESIDIQQVAETPPGPGVVGEAYQFNPAGATFNPPATLKFTYDPADVPEGVAEESLVIAYWSDEAGEWINLPSEVDPATHTITAKVSHFTIFAVLQPPMADFSYSTLSIAPDEVDAGEAVEATMLVSNVGGAAGSWELTLKIDGFVETTREVTVEANDAEEVSFSIVRDTPGMHLVDINGVTGSFVVKEAPVTGVSVFAVTPAYHAQTGTLDFADVVYEVNNLQEATGNIKLILKAGREGWPPEEISLLSLDRPESNEISGSLEYTPYGGWRSGTYTFRVELYVGGVLSVPATEQELEVTPSEAAPVYNWVVLGEIIGAALFIIGVTVFLVLLRRRRILRAQVVKSETSDQRPTEHSH